jgi:hypothetical protein
MKNWKPKPTISHEDNRVVVAARESGIYCMVSRDGSGDALYTFYDKTTGRLLSKCDNHWESALNRAIDRKRSL